MWEVRLAGEKGKAFNYPALRGDTNRTQVY